MFSISISFRYRLVFRQMISMKLQRIVISPAKISRNWYGRLCYSHKGIYLQSTVICRKNNTRALVIDGFLYFCTFSIISKIRSSLSFWLNYLKIVLYLSKFSQPLLCTCPIFLNPCGRENSPRPVAILRLSALLWISLSESMEVCNGTTVSQ